MINMLMPVNTLKIHLVVYPCVQSVGSGRYGRRKASSLVKVVFTLVSNIYDS
jgi:hypothetical protein